MSIPLWDQCKWISQSADDSSIVLGKSENPLVVFECNSDINKKLYLYSGEIYKVPADAIIIGQNESLNDKNDGNDSLSYLAGPELEYQILDVAPVQTGDSVLTTGGLLPCQYIIHAVGPKYDEKYLTASEQALYSAYHSALLLASSNNIKDLIIGCIYLKSKKYPRFEAAHVALRTVRKFLNHAHLCAAFDRVMFCVPTQDDFEIYSALMCAYFPRTLAEEKEQYNLLPCNLGDEWGQIVLADRRLTVSVGPQPLSGTVLKDYRSAVAAPDTFSTCKKTGNREIVPVEPLMHTMLESGEDRDELRKKKVAEEFSRMSRGERLKLRFQSMLDDVEPEDLQDLRDMAFVRIAGVDRLGNSVVLITGANLQCTGEQERVLLYFMSVMEDLRCLPFVLVYAHSHHSVPDSSLVQDVFDLFASRYKENLQQLYILHASLYFRMYLWMALPFLATPFWSNYICVKNLKELNAFIEVSELDMPPIIAEQEEH